MKSIKCLYLKAQELMSSKFPNANTSDYIKKLCNESNELLQSPYDLDEYADVLISLLTSIGNSNFSLQQVIEQSHKKIKICKKANWIKQADGTYQRQKL